MAITDSNQSKDLILKDVTLLSHLKKSRISKDCSRSLSNVKSFKMASYKNMSFNVGDYISTSNGYGILDGIYQFNNDMESTMCHVRLLQILTSTAILHYPQISSSHIMSTMYIPISDVRGRLHTVKVGNLDRLMVLHVSSMLIVNE